MRGLGVSRLCITQDLTNKEAGPMEGNRPSYRETTMMTAKAALRALPQIHARQSSAS